ncbi:MAG: hypothetical protein JKY45_10420 [Emcibacter sp.]|nr:hypothetical protein [Emcibacter sp.]
MARSLTKQKIKAIRIRINRGEQEDKILSAEKISEEQLWHIRKDYNDVATPETTSKLKRDPLKNLESRGMLDEYHLLAADMIRSAIQIRIGGLGVKCASIESRVDQKGKRPTESESEWSIRVQEKYSLWMQLCVFEKPRIQTMPIIDILMEPVSFKEMDRAWGQRKGWTRDHLVRGLKLYCQTFQPKKNP